MQGINACIEPLTDVVIPPGGRYIQTVNYGKPLAFGPYKAFISLNDTTNSHKATLTTLFTVEQPPQVVQQVIMPPVVLSEKPLVVQVKTLNISSRVFSQDLRLCYTDFVIRDKRQQVVYETPSTQVCTADLQVTSVKPGASFTANWRLDVTLKPGTYEIQHKSFWGTPLTTFEVR